ncbi:MAG: hypothetical protein ABR860_04865 [Terracidiphilus sp.]|jgi:hypothetical protein
MPTSKLISILLVTTAFGGAPPARAKVIEDASGSLATLTSIGDALNAPDHHPVHILYVHGINQIGAGDSSLLRESICTRLKLCDVKDWKNAGVEFPDRGEFADGVNPPTLAYLGSPVWKSADEWHAAAPFVVHWVVHLRGRSSPLVVDEINWWPLLLSLKCRRVMVPEAHLAGPDRDLLQLCSERNAQVPDGMGRFYAWITPEDAAQLEILKPQGAWLNRNLKDNLVDWGLADVLLATSQLDGILRDGIRQLMARSAAFDPNQAAASPNTDQANEHYNWKAQLGNAKTLDQEFVGVTHSLGSYLFFNALNPDAPDASAPAQSTQPAAIKADEDSAVQYIFQRTSLVYFFANQIQMLEITNLENTAQPSAPVFQSRGLSAPSAPTAPAENFRTLVNRWKQMQTDFQTTLHPGDEAAQKKVQVVAWSDPSDVITFRVPKIGDVDVVNLYVHNAHRWFGFFESPGAAHTDYAKNKDVLRVMFKSSKPTRTH